MHLQIRRCLLLLPMTMVVALEIPSYREEKMCIWSYDKDFPKNPPLILNKDDGVVLPELVDDKRIVKVLEGERMKMVCAGNGNVFKKKVNKKHVQTFKVKCQPKTKNNLHDTDNKKDYEMKDMGCKSPIKSSIKETADKEGKKECANNQGILYDIGFEDDEKLIYSLITVCFDDNAKITHWTRHTLHGKNIAAARQLQQGKQFTVSGFFKGVGMDLIYKKKSQRKLMDRINSQRVYLEKGHLAPKGDFITNTDKIATYFYINSAPQWREINIGNWLIVIVQNEDKSKTNAVAFIVINNPYREVVPDPEDLPCKNVCDDIKWLNDEKRIDNFKKEMREDLCFGYTICCEVNEEFRKNEHLSFLPVTKSYDLLTDLDF